jgi:hypothetical protein
MSKDSNIGFNNTKTIIIVNKIITTLKGEYFMRRNGNMKITMAEE